jgi:hypothetical protein
MAYIFRPDARRKQFLIRKEGNSLFPLAQILPEFLCIACPWKTTGHANDGYGIEHICIIGVYVIHGDFLPPAAVA